MSLAFEIAQGSVDPDTKHGTVIVDDCHAILSTGYNSFPQGCDDENLPFFNVSYTK